MHMSTIRDWMNYMFYMYENREFVGHDFAQKIDEEPFCPMPSRSAYPVYGFGSALVRQPIPILKERVVVGTPHMDRDLRHGAWPGEG